jgi:hypothetical protein
MSYDEELAARVRAEVAPQPGMDEKPMFGGLAFLVDGKLACSVTRGGLMVRLGPDDAATASTEPGVRPLDMGGRPMKGWVVVDTGRLDDDDVLGSWVRRGAGFARSLAAE